MDDAICSVPDANTIMIGPSPGLNGPTVSTRVAMYVPSTMVPPTAGGMNGTDANAGAVTPASESELHVPASGGTPPSQPGDPKHDKDPEKSQ